MLRLLFFFRPHEEVSTGITALPCGTMFSRWIEAGFIWSLTACIWAFLHFRWCMRSSESSQHQPCSTPITPMDREGRVRAVLSLRKDATCRGCQGGCMARGQLGPLPSPMVMNVPPFVGLATSCDSRGKGQGRVPPPVCLCPPLCEGDTSLSLHNPTLPSHYKAHTRFWKSL